MSLASWKKEFFGDLKKAQKSNLAALEHSIRKWEGLRPENLERHKLTCSEGLFRGILDKSGKFLEICDESCSLCLMYCAGLSEPCHGCPLYEIRGVRCDKMMEHEERSPWGAWNGETRNPIPMLDWLRVAERYEKARET